MTKWEDPDEEVRAWVESADWLEVVLEDNDDEVVDVWLEFEVVVVDDEVVDDDEVKGEVTAGAGGGR